MLNREHMKGYEAKKLDPKKASADDVAAVRAYMCENYFDVRTFGAVMSTEISAGQVRGPVQLTFGRSIGPVVSLEHTITRMAVTNERDLDKERTMGRKSTVPYGLYRTHGFVSAAQAQDTGFSAADLDLLWTGLVQMFEHDRSAARGLMTTRALVVFRHDSALGNAPAHTLFERVSVHRKDGVSVPRSFSDYEVLAAVDGLPNGVSVVPMPV